MLRLPTVLKQQTIIVADTGSGYSGKFPFTVEKF